MKNENLLSDLENDIEGDWEDIQENVREKESKEEFKKKMEYLKNHPARMNFPNFHEFYELMLEIYINYDDKQGVSHSISALRSILARMFSYHGYDIKMAPAFDYVWKMFCDPGSFLFHTIGCKGCYRIWDVITYRKRLHAFDIDIDREMFGSYSQTMEIYRIACPSCGFSMGSITNKLIGMIEHKEITEEQSDDINFIKKYLEERGYDLR